MNAHNRSKLFFLPAGIPCGLFLLLTAVSRYTLPGLTVPLLVLTGIAGVFLLGAWAGYRREGVWQKDGRILLRILQSPWAVAVRRTNLTLTFPGGIRRKVRSVRCEDISFMDL